MKILHISNTAGVAGVIAKYMDRLFNARSMVVQRSNRVCFPVYGEVWDCGPKMFTLKCLLKARKFDIIHVHYFDKIIPYLRLLYPRKPIVMHYHGDDIRGKWSLRRKYWSKADAVLYSTLELLDEETPQQAVYMPNPVDTEIFHPCSIEPKPKTAFHFSYNADDVAVEYARRYGLELTIYDKQKHGVIPHLKLPEVLCQYEYYVDVKRVSGGKIGSALSKTGFEALACNLKVIRWDGEIMEGLPPENHPENVAKKIFDIYLKV
jgi:glycosyltransferase involved in cell wall biosynthesis